MGTMLCVSILRKLFRPKPAMSVGYATEVVTEYLLVQEMIPVDKAMFIPADALSHKPQVIYEALITLAQHDGHWERWSGIANTLSRFSGSAYDCFCASWALVTDDVDQLFDVEKERRIRLQADQADCSAAIKSDFEALQRSRPRTGKPKFPGQRLDDDIEGHRIESVVHEFGTRFTEGQNAISLALMPGPLEEVMYCLASWYVRASEMTHADWQHFRGGAVLMHRVCWSDEAKIVNNMKLLSPAEYQALSEQELAWYKYKRTVHSNYTDRAPFAINYWTSVFELMCRRLSIYNAIELPNHAS